MRITLIDGKTGDIHAVEPAHTRAKPEPLIIDSEAAPNLFQAESASEKPASWKPVHFQDGTVIEVNIESGEIIGQ